MIQKIVLLAIFTQIMVINESLAKKRLCGEALYRHLTRVCTFGYETIPCFKSRFASLISEKANNTNKSLSGRAVVGIANHCCQEGCTVLDLRTTCCFKLSCLKKCYPKSNYEKRVKNAEIVQIT